MLSYYTDLPHPYNKIGDGPEGPEIKTVADKLINLVNSTIINIEQTEHGKFKSTLVYPVQITKISAYGKKLIWTLHTNDLLIFSFGMTGRLQFEPGKHSNVIIHLHDNLLYFDDTRRMGNIIVVLHQDIGKYFLKLGPDMLQSALNNHYKSGDYITFDTWKVLLSKHSKKEICKVLLDQTIITGIGNYIKSEVLYYAGILPSRTVSTLTDEELQLLLDSIHYVMLYSYAYGGFTIQDFISPDGTTGNYPSVVYNKSHDPFNNEVIKYKTSDNRTSHCVPALQF